MAVTGAITSITVAMGFYIKSKNDKIKADQDLVSGAESLRREMEKNNGELNENVLLTTEQINAKEELEKQLKKETGGTNSLSIAMERYNAYIKDFEKKCSYEVWNKKVYHRKWKGPKDDFPYSVT